MSHVTASWQGGEIGGWGVLVHGGAGDVAPERRPGHQAGCRQAASLAAEVLGAGGSALDAAVVAVSLLEDLPQYNAGTGCSLTSDGRVELDAALMEGATLSAGAVGCLGPFKNPVQVARVALEQGEHVFYVGQGADRFARDHGFEPLPEDQLVTPAARRKLEAALADGKAANWAGGTVGAVVRDAAGLVVAATSTGGTAGKHPGRVGDSPLVAGGTYADNRLGACSVTGWGEGILRLGTALRATLALTTSPPRTASELLVDELRERLDAPAGLIVAHPDGTLGWARSTSTMSWGAAWPGGLESGS